MLAAAAALATAHSQRATSAVATARTTGSTIDRKNMTVIEFPRHISDLDGIANNVLGAGAELDADHPGFTDAEYRERRRFIAAAAALYRSGQPIPFMEYTEQEKQTWKTVFNTLRDLQLTNACREHNVVMQQLVEHCGLGPNSVPQLQTISEFLQKRTGFTLRPVMGLLSPRDFLAGLAHRVFHATQYMRHHARPLYTPEPDLCHELLGHAPLFADPDFAEFSQMIGMASLGASDEDIKKLSTLYWFTVEFGLCKENGQLKAYGAGLLSSFGELEYCLSGQPEYLPFDPYAACDKDYPITTYQPAYFVAESFKDMKMKVREYVSNIQRPFAVRYNALTQTVEVLENVEQLVRFVGSIQADLQVLTTALSQFA